MKTLTVDDYKRVRLPDAKPGQVWAYEKTMEGQITLTAVKKTEQKDPFPPGSLAECVEQINREFAPIVKKMKVPAPPEDWE